MNEEFVVKGAVAKCMFGVNTAKLNVLDNPNVYFNGKLLATDKSLGPTFQPPAFGTCKMVPTAPKPCVANIVSWANFYAGAKVNGISHPLTKNSRGTCALGCPMCISFSSSGQE